MLHCSFGEKRILWNILQKNGDVGETKKESDCGSSHNHKRKERFKISMKKRQEILEYAYMCSPFYQSLMEDHHLEIDRLRKDWDCIPIISKAMISRAGETIIPFSYYTEKVKGNLLTKVTAGSTGKCLKIFWNAEDLRREEELVWKYRELWYGIQKGSLYCYFYTFEENETMEQEYHNVEGGIGIPKYGLCKARVEQIYQRLCSYQPKWLLLAPSIAKVLMKYIKETGVEKIESLRYIELYGELISEQEREEVETVFGCIARRRYGCKEVGTIAYECPYGEMHILTENVHVEVCREGHAVYDGMEGNIIVTSLQNHVMPFVRYDTDDMGILRKTSCKCGLEGEMLEIVRGQESQWIQVDDNRYFHSSDFTRAFLKIMYHQKANLTQYQIIQRKRDYFDVYFVSETDEEIIKKAFLEEMVAFNFKNAEFQFHCLNEKLLAKRVGINSYFRCEVKG